MFDSFEGSFEANCKDPFQLIVHHVTGRTKYNDWPIMQPQKAKPHDGMLPRLSEMRLLCLHGKSKVVLSILLKFHVIKFPPLLFSSSTELAKSLSRIPEANLQFAK